VTKAKLTIFNHCQPNLTYLYLQLKILVTRAAITTLTQFAAPKANPTSTNAFLSMTRANKKEELNCSTKEFAN